jgi:hypothetical protein
MTDQTAQTGRRIDLDWIRITAFGLLIFYHVGMLYVPWDFHIKSRHILPALEPLMLALNPWRLGLLFLVSGAATRVMTKTRPPAALFASRAARLLPPLLFGIWVVVPPQSYVELVQRWGYAGDFAEFYRSFELALPRQLCQVGHCLILPTWNHLWFVVYLLTYTTLLACMLAAAPAVLRRLEVALTPLLAGSGLLLLPVSLLAAHRIGLQPHFPATFALVGDWASHALYGPLFLFGYLFAGDPRIASATQRLRWPALAAALSGFFGYLLLRSLGPGDPPALPLRLASGIAYATLQWCSIVAILGFGRIWLTRDGPARRYLTAAVFPFYIVHQTAIILTAHALRDRGWPVAAEASTVIAVTIACCFASYEVVRRTGWLRPLFGLKPA